MPRSGTRASPSPQPRSIVRPSARHLSADSVQGPRLTPLPPHLTLHRARGFGSFSVTRLRPDPPSAGSSRVRRPAVHKLLDRAVSPGLAHLPLCPQGNSTRPVPGPALVRTLRVTACQTDLARPRRCADPGRSVAADSPENPPIRRVVCLPRAARGYPRSGVQSSITYLVPNILIGFHIREITDNDLPDQNARISPYIRYCDSSQNENLGC